MKVLKNKKNQKGQAAIEFMISVIVIFFFLFFFLSLSILLVTSEYIDYATFMAARTYRSAYDDREQQEINARRVFQAYTERIQGIGRNFDLKVAHINPEDEQTAGIQASYDMDLFYLPPVFVPGSETAARIRLSSESHLGRDPGFNECSDYFLQFVQRLNIPNMEIFYRNMDDNGC